MSIDKYIHLYIYFTYHLSPVFYQLHFVYSVSQPSHSLHSMCKIYHMYVHHQSLHQCHPSHLGSLKPFLRKGSQEQYCLIVLPLACCRVFLCPLYLKITPAEYYILDSYFLSLTILNMLPHFLLRKSIAVGKTEWQFHFLSLIIHLLFFLGVQTIFPSCLFLSLPDTGLYWSFRVDILRYILCFFFQYVF